MVKIRRAKLEDSREIYKILNGTKELRGFSDGEAYSRQWLEEVIKDKKRNIFLLKQVEENIAGFLIAHVLPGKDIFFNDIYVKPEYRKQNIAFELIKEMDKISKKLNSKFTLGLVLLNNSKMQNLIKKCGFKKGHTFDYYYRVRK